MQKDHLPLFSLTVGEFKELLKNSINEYLEEIPKSKSYNDDQLIKIGELCKTLNVSRVSVFNWIKNGKIKSYHLNSRLYFKMKDIEAALNSRRKGGHE
jgi:hypothetical protein